MDDRTLMQLRMQYMDARARGDRRKMQQIRKFFRIDDETHQLEAARRIQEVASIMPPSMEMTNYAGYMAYARNIEKGQVHLPYEQVRPSTPLHGRTVAPPKSRPGVRNCQSCHWDYWHDPAEEREVEWRTSEKWCEYCHYVLALEGMTAQVVPMTRWGRIMLEVYTVRAWLSYLGMLGLMYLGGHLIAWVLGLFIGG